MALRERRGIGPGTMRLLRLCLEFYFDYKTGALGRVCLVYLLFDSKSSYAISWLITT